MSWTQERKAAQKAACAASAAARRCKSCGKGAAMRLADPKILLWTCRYCGVNDCRDERMPTRSSVSSAA
jgi:ribosomal protein L37AE/L43A